MSYGLVFWGNSYLSNIIVKLQKRIITIWWGLEIVMQRTFQKIKNITITVSIYIYIYSLLLFVINNRQHFKINSDMHNINTGNDLDFHYPQAPLSVYQKGAHYTGIKFNRLPGAIK
jgi:hypothetical protein